MYVPRQLSDDVITVLPHVVIFVDVFTCMAVHLCHKRDIYININKYTNIFAAA